MLTLAVPIYNMEKYLPRCMNTLLSQTCQDFEILLIDDGSTDNSGVICDSYAAEHPELVRVIHKNNGGLSSARNTGIDAARGEHIIFPDPDDWVEPDYVQHLMELQKLYDADLVCTGYYIDTNDTSIPGSADTASAILTGEVAQRGLLLPPKMNGFAWNKLYRLSIIREHALKFLDDVGVTEDLDFAYRYLVYAKKVSHAPALRTYHYYQHPGAATNSGYSTRKLDSIHTYEKIAADCADRDPELQTAAQDEICVTAVNLLWAWELGDHRNREGRRQLLLYIRHYLPIHLKSHRYGTGRKLQALTAAVSPKLFTKLKKIAQKL